MATYFLGTAGWSFEFWTHKFYPRNVKKHLEYYAGESPLVEVNTTFYNFPSPALVQNWYEQTPEHFRFSAKMYRMVTHQQTPWQINHYDLNIFFHSLDPLQEKLSHVLIQMPPYFSRNELNQIFIEDLVEQSMKRTGATLAIEFRHTSWFEEEVYQQLQNCVMVITPFLHISLPDQLDMHLEHLGSSVYIRLFGNRREMPDNKLGTLRLNKHSELLRFTEILLDYDSRLSEVLVFLTNQFSGYAPGDAYDLHRMMREKGMEVNGFRPPVSLDDFF